MSVVFQKVCPETKPIVAADAPISERKAPRMLSALSFVISENILTMPKSRMNSIARDISLFLAIKMKRFSLKYIIILVFSQALPEIYSDRLAFCGASAGSDFSYLCEPG